MDVAIAPIAALYACRRMSVSCPGRQDLPRRPVSRSRRSATLTAASASLTPVTRSYAAMIARVTGRPCFPAPPC
jgi:hypothetical protein